MNLQNFVYNNNQVRTIIKNNEPWFVAKDVCDILEIKNATVAVSRLDVSILDLMDSGDQTR